MARIAPGRATSSSWRNTRPFTSMSSKTASMTRSEFAMSPKASVGARRPMFASSASAVRAALLQRRFVVAPNRRHALGERLGIRLDERDGKAGAQEIHCDPATHRPRAHDCHALDLARRRVLGKAGNLRGRPLGEERVPQRARFRRLHELHELRALEAQPFGERFAHRGRNRVHALERRGQALGHGGDRIARELEKGLRVRDSR